jgi:hypothetical protein
MWSAPFFWFYKFPMVQKILVMKGLSGVQQLLTHFIRVIHPS